VDDYFCCILMSAVCASGAALDDFVELARSEVPGEEVGWLINRLDEGASVVAPMRVATWGYVNRVIALNWPERVDEVHEVAVSGLGIESEAEKRVAQLDPRVGTADETGAQLRFHRTVLGGLVESVNGETGNAEIDLPSIMLWSGSFAENWSEYELMLERLAPAGPS
jgi:hypothetical protein